MSSLFKKLFEYLCISLAQPEKQRGIGAQVVERRCHAKVIGGRLLVVSCGHGDEIQYSQQFVVGLV